MKQQSNTGGKRRGGPGKPDRKSPDKGPGRPKAGYKAAGTGKPKDKSSSPGSGRPKDRPPSAGPDKQRERFSAPRPGKSEDKQERNETGKQREKFKTRGAGKLSERYSSAESGKGKEGLPAVRSSRTSDTTDIQDSELIRLNRFLSNAGVCSRREADTLISEGLVKVNGEIITQLGSKVKRSDTVECRGKVLRSEVLRYILLNKPRGYITSMSDEKERKTVMELIKGACSERVYPVGRLDRVTTGLLLLSNDGMLTEKLTHPSHGVRKMYHAVLDKPLEMNDFQSILNGIVLDDGPIKVDSISYVKEGLDPREIGLELHSGRNRIVRRIFEHLGYDVVKLDRVKFASLTKKDLPRGSWRFLTEKELSFLKMI